MLLEVRARLLNPLIKCFLAHNVFVVTSHKEEAGLDTIEYVIVERIRKPKQRNGQDQQPPEYALEAGTVSGPIRLNNLIQG